jgi:E3 SUMO-protein ligase PIAS1
MIPYSWMGEYVMGRCELRMVLMLLNRFVQDILDRVPEEEETVLIDSEGKWQTPNEKFTSEGSADGKGVPRNGTKEDRSSSTSTPAHTKTNGKPKVEEDASLTPPRTAPSKSRIEVFEIDDDEDAPATETEKEPAEKARQSPTTAANSSIPASKEQPNLSRSSSTTMSRPQSFYSAATLPSQQSLSSLTANPGPSTPPIEKAAVQVIDLTLSDSEDEDRVSAPRQMPNYTTSYGEGRASANRDQSWAQRPAARHDSHASSWRSFSATNGNGSNGAMQQQREGSSTVAVSAQAATSRPERRSNSHFEEEEDETHEADDDDDDGPVRRQRRRLQQKTMDGDGKRTRRSDSEGLSEDERAGLTLNGR